MEHYPPLYAAYATLVIATLAILRLGPHSTRGLWPAQDLPAFKRPWRQLGVAVLAIVGIILIGQLYQAGLLFPTKHELGWLAEAANQALIFAPVPIAIALTRRGPETALLSKHRLAPRALIACALATLSAAVFCLVKFGWEGPAALLAIAARPETLAHAVQVFMEDAAIAFVLVSLIAVTKREWIAAALVAALFIAAHIPAMASRGDLSAAEFAMRALDIGIALIVLVGLLRTRDLLWLYPTHLLLDLTQFIELA